MTVRTIVLAAVITGLCGHAEAGQVSAGAAQASHPDVEQIARSIEPQAVLDAGAAAAPSLRTVDVPSPAPQSTAAPAPKKGKRWVKWALLGVAGVIVWLVVVHALTPST